ncbi:uncharacterized protein LOC130761511 [Actinidia eriantha]|uniref:uncharacterized protein LOC130761511 n=1 Tax=Actinidia eriantha TaxID=165200 RepID=UPI00258C249A|nr:uncharacterized protein LOC130761511 [Actinidia eriantha]
MENSESENSDNSRSSINKLPADDPSNPYFHHHSDGPGLVLVSQSLTGDNYASWNRAMTIALSVKNKLGFIDGSITKPEGNDTNLLNSWIRNNNVVISWILNSVSKEISASIIFSASAYEIWIDLKDRFQQSNGPRIFQLRRELMNHVQDQSPVSVYFTKLKTIWEELNNYRPACSCGNCTCGGVKKLNSHYQMEYIMSFLMGLHDSFAQIRGQLLLMDPLPPINKVFSLISQEEHQRKIGIHVNSISNSADTMAFAIKNENLKRFSDKSGSSNSGGYRGNQNSASYKGQKKDRPFCTHCNFHGHTIEKCYKLHGYPPGFKPRSRDAYATSNSHNAVNQVSNHSCSSSEARNDQEDNVGNFVTNLNSNQYQQLMCMLSNHMASSVKDQQDNPSTSYTTDSKREEKKNGRLASKKSCIFKQL